MSDTKPIQHTSSSDIIEVIGARVHNLKNISVHIPRHQLTVITGLSGSGKSSLAFDTLYAEGQRRYIDTFSAYARGYMGSMARPDVDKITGLSPVISIDQKTTNKNPRSTVGTATEVYDYLRLLFARAGEAYSYLTGEKMVHYSDDQIIDLLLQQYAGQKVLLLAPLVKGRKGHYKELFERYRKKGFMYMRIDGEVRELMPGMKVDRYKVHHIELVVDRLKAPSNSPMRGRTQSVSEDRKRLLESVGKAMQQGGGIMMVAGESSGAKYFSRNLMCPTTGLSYADPAPATFSFNSPQGACPHCKGLGIVNGAEELENFLAPLNPPMKGGNQTQSDVQHILSTPEGNNLPPLWGERGGLDGIDGLEWEEVMLCPECKGARLNKEALSFRIGDKNIADLVAMDIRELHQYLTDVVHILTDKQRTIADEILKEIQKRLQFMMDVGLSYLSLGRNSDSLSGGEHQRIRLATQIGSQLVNVLYILDEPSIGLHQRDNERLILSLKHLRDMGNTIIVVEHDEQMMREADWVIDIGPKAGRLGGKVVFEGTPQDLLKSDTLTAKYLAPSNSPMRGRTPNPKQYDRAYQTSDPALYDLLKQYSQAMRKNPTQAESALWEMLRNNNLGASFRRQHIIMDYIVDFVCFEKMLVIEVDGGYHCEYEQQISDAERDRRLTAMGFTVLRFTNEQVLIDIDNTIKTISTALQPSPFMGGTKGALILHGCTGNNLKSVDVAFPLGQMIGVTGVSGSGKSTLINQTLYPILQQHLYRSQREPMPYESIDGLEYIDKVVAVDQSPIGRTPRSNPATYTGVFNDIRNLFVQLPESQIRGWKPGRFSFNTVGGRCETCAGNGYKTIQMHFLPDVYVPCESCGGKRYNKETLEVRFKGKTIADVLDMTINQAVEFFESQPYILNKIRTMQDVGLGYIKLGQSSTTLSGGESQRMKLAAELSKRDTGRTVYILDEPTTGLHFEDIRILLGVLRQLVEKGNTMIIIEHNLDVIRACDYLIDMGPEGGNGGGQVVATGTPEEVRKNKHSITGGYISPLPSPHERGYLQSNPNLM